MSRKTGTKRPSAGRPAKKPPRKHDYHHGDLRRELIVTATRILQTEGHEQLTLRRCAKEAGVSPAAPAHHFANLNGLLTAVATKGFEALAQTLKAALHAPTDRDHDGLKSLASGYLQFAKKNPALYRVMFTPKLDKEEKSFADANQECFHILRNEVARRDQGQSSETVEVLTFKTWALAHGFVLLVLNDRLDLIVGREKTFKNEKELEEAFLKYLYLF